MEDLIPLLDQDVNDVNAENKFDAIYGMELDGGIKIGARVSYASNGNSDNTTSSDENIVTNDYADTSGTDAVYDGSSSNNANDPQYTENVSDITVQLGVNVANVDVVASYGIASIDNAYELNTIAKTYGQKTGDTSTSAVTLMQTTQIANSETLKGNGVGFMDVNLRYTLKLDDKSTLAPYANYNSATKSTNYTKSNIQTVTKVKDVGGNTADEVTTTTQKKISSLYNIAWTK